LVFVDRDVRPPSWSGRLAHNLKFPIHPTFRFEDSAGPQTKPLLLRTFPPPPHPDNREMGCPHRPAGPHCCNLPPRQKKCLFSLLGKSEKKVGSHPPGTSTASLPLKCRPLTNQPPATKTPLYRPESALLALVVQTAQPARALAVGLWLNLYIKGERPGPLKKLTGQKKLRPSPGCFPAGGLCPKKPGKGPMPPPSSDIWGRAWTRKRFAPAKLKAASPIPPLGFLGFPGPARPGFFQEKVGPRPTRKKNFSRSPLVNTSPFSFCPPFRPLFSRVSLSLAPRSP